MILRNRTCAALACSAVIALGFAVVSTSAIAQKKTGAPSKAAIEAGKVIYTANGCAACHKIAGKGGVTSTDLSKIGKTMKAAQLADVVRKGDKNKTGVVMAAYGPDKISDKELKQLVAYLQTLK